MSGSCGETRETSGDSWRLLEIIGDYWRLLESDSCGKGLERFLERNSEESRREKAVKSSVMSVVKVALDSGVLSSNSGSSLISIGLIYRVRSWNWPSSTGHPTTVEQCGPHSSRKNASSQSDCTVIHNVLHVKIYL